jgi:hypothetical protein
MDPDVVEASQQLLDDHVNNERQLQATGIDTSRTSLTPPDSEYISLPGHVSKIKQNQQQRA